MSSHQFGRILRLSTWGESHGPAIGLVLDGCPAGIKLDIAFIQQRVNLRSPGRNKHVSPRKEADRVQVLSGLFEGMTTGMPISMMIENLDVDSRSYDQQKHILRPGHANYTYLQKYGVFDHRGGGRASARETACRVAAGAIAEQMLNMYGITVFAYLHAIADIQTHMHDTHRCIPNREEIEKSPLFCADPVASQGMQARLDEAIDNGDSLGGVVEFCVHGAPAGLGDPLYEKLDARLAYAMMSIPASKAFEIGSGHRASQMTGTTHNDTFQADALRGGDPTTTNHAGGLLGGISTGMPIYGRVSFKPTSTVKNAQKTVDLQGQPTALTLRENGRHDPCIAIRAVPVVQAMCALVVADAVLCNSSARIPKSSDE